MTLSLRERRRLETAREIQLMTLKMAVQNGLENITTEEIASAAGISIRTFFNYYTNKEAAAIGSPPPFTEEAKDALRHGTGSLAEDLKQFLDQHMQLIASDEPILKMIGTLLQTNEVARDIFKIFLGSERMELTECLNSRLNDLHTAAALAGSANDAIGRAILLWEHSENMSLAEALDIIWDAMISASALLTPPDPAQ